MIFLVKYELSSVKFYLRWQKRLNAVAVSVLATVTVVAVVAVTSALFVISKVCDQQIGATPKLAQSEHTEGVAFVQEVTKF